jgi:hypothetical protein
MRQQRPRAQRRLALSDESPATLSPEQESALIRALAELLLEVARSEARATRGGDDEHEDRR